MARSINSEVRLGFGASLGTCNLEREKQLHDKILINPARGKMTIAFSRLDSTRILQPFRRARSSPNATSPENILAELGRPDAECNMLAFAIVATDTAGLALWASRPTRLAG